MHKNFWKIFIASIVAGMLFIVGILAFKQTSYLDEKKMANVPQNSKETLLQRDTLSLGEVYTRDEMRQMIEGFGQPDEEDIIFYKKDERYGFVLDKLQQADVSEEMRDRFLAFMLLFWFRQDVLGDKYNQGEIDMDGHDFGLSVLVEGMFLFSKENLTDEQYLLYEGEKKSDTVASFPEKSDSTNGFAAIVSLFPPIRNGKYPEIQSAEDVYRRVPRSAIEKISIGSKERLRIQQEAIRDLRLERISREVYKNRLEEGAKIMRDTVKTTVTPKQEEFLFGDEL